MFPLVPMPRLARLYVVGIDNIAPGYVVRVVVVDQTILVVLGRSGVPLVSDTVANGCTPMIGPPKEQRTALMATTYHYPLWRAVMPDSLGRSGRTPTRVESNASTHQCLGMSLSVVFRPYCSACILPGSAKLL